VSNAMIKLYPRWRKLERPDLYAKTMVYRRHDDGRRGSRPARRHRRAAAGWLSDAEMSKIAKGVKLADVTDDATWFEAATALRATS
jgi:hypothetical protein